MILSVSLISLLLSEIGNRHVSGYVTAFAPKTYDVYDRPTPRLDTPRASITQGLELRDLRDPEFHKPKALNSRPTSYPSISHALATVNNTQECALWDPACHGNRSAAVLDFFNTTMPKLLEDSCFTTGPQWDMVCTQNPLPGPPLINSWSTIRSWMRSPACQTARDEAHRLDPSIRADDHSTCAGCCGDCGIGGPNVDVYYWESPNANTDCLSIVGTHVSPLLDGATTEGGTTYWAVTTLGTEQFNSIFTTAVYTSVNGISFKLPLHNPWDAMTQNGGPVPTTSAAISAITAPPAGLQSVNTRANAIPIRHIRPRAGRNLNQTKFPTTEAPSLPTNGSQVSTVIYNGHTFTSPSIYVDFYSLAATDDCGYVGSSSVLTSTLLSFAPGELSTYGGPLIDILHAELFTPTAYNFADLPCPPKSIMYNQWYKPEPGHPFRPILAFPSKVLGIDPAWASCTANLFTGIDPPRALETTNAMAAPVKAPNTFAPQTLSVSVPSLLLGTQPQPSPAHKQQNPQMVAPQATTPPPVSTTQDPSYTRSTSPAKLGNKQATPQIFAGVPANPGNKEATPQISNEVAAPAAQPFASVGGHPIVALSLQQASGSLDHSISATASDISNSQHVGDSSKSNDGPAVDEAPAQGSSQASDIGTIQKAPNVDATPASKYDSGAIVGTNSSTGDKGGAPVNDDSQNTSPSDNEQSSNQKDLTNNLPNQKYGPIRQVYQVGSSQITAGGPTLTISGTVVFAPASGDCVVVGGQTFHPPPLSVSLSGNTFITGAQPTSLGEQQQVSFDNQDAAQVPNSQTNILALPEINVGDKTFIRLPSNAGVAVDGITLLAGRPDVTLSGTPVSLDSDYNIHVAGSTYALSASSAFPAEATGKGGVAEAHASTATTIAGEALELLGNGISVGGTTLSPGVKATGNGGQVVSNAGNGIVVVGNQTATLGSPSADTGARSTGSKMPGGNFQPFEGRASRSRGMECWQWVWLFAAMLWAW